MKQSGPTRALFSVVELLGDMIEILPALYGWKHRYPHCEITLRLQDQPHCHFMENLPGIKVEFIPGDFDQVRNPPDKSEFDFFHLFNIPEASSYSWGKDKHISEGYARKLNVDPQFGYTKVQLPPAKPHNIVDHPYLVIIPFCGGTPQPDGGSERNFPGPVWANIIDVISREVPVEIVVLGYSKIKADELETRIPAHKFTYVSEESVLGSVEIILGSNCWGFISPDSGLLHAINYYAKQYRKVDNPLTTLACLTTVIPLNVSLPHNIPPSWLQVYRSYPAKVKYYPDLAPTILHYCSKLILQHELMKNVPQVV